MNPEVTIIIPTYNSEEYIAQALKSVFAQTHHNWEIVMVDDASGDSTVEIACSFQDPRLKIIQNTQNRGVSYSRNRAIKEARGKWIALLDSDDWYAPQRLEKLLAVADRRDVNLIADNLFLIKDNQQHHWSTLLQENQQVLSSPIETIDAVKFVTSDRLSPINNKPNWSLGYTKPLIEREFLLENNIWYREDINVGEDFILYLECLMHQAKFCLVNQPYYYYRTRDFSLSTRRPIDYLAQSCKITQAFIDRELLSSTNSELLHALSENLVIFQKRLAYYQLINDITARKFFRAIDRAINDPYILWDLLKKLVILSKRRVAKTFKIKQVERSSYPQDEQKYYSDTIYIAIHLSNSDRLDSKLKIF